MNYELKPHDVLTIHFVTSSLFYLRTHLNTSTLKHFFSGFLDLLRHGLLFTSSPRHPFTYKLAHLPKHLHTSTLTHSNTSTLKHSFFFPPVFYKTTSTWFLPSTNRWQLILLHQWLRNSSLLKNNSANPVRLLHHQRYPRKVLPVQPFQRSDEVAMQRLHNFQEKKYTRLHNASAVVRGSNPIPGKIHF